MAHFSNSVSEHIEKHLYNDLRWMLCAATEWSACHKYASQWLANNDPEYHRHLIVYSMDSALVHARALLEFFTQRSVLGLVSGLSSPLYINTWKAPMNHYLMHVYSRSNTLRSSVVIKEEILAISNEVLRLWDELASAPQMISYKSIFDSQRKKAIEETEVIAKRYERFGFNSPFA